VVDRQNHVQRLTAPLRSVAQRFTFLVLLMSAVAILLFGKADPTVFERTRVVVIDTTAPVLAVLSRPVATVAAFIEEIGQLAVLRDENAALRQENARLEVWQSMALKYDAENTRLRDLLQYIPEPPAKYVAARVIADSSGAFVRSLLVNVGSRNGIANGQAAVVGADLIGRVAEVGQTSARILLLSDLNSRIPVLVAASRARAVLAGDNSPLQRLLYLSANAQVKPGDEIVTSGHGGVFPVGLRIGTVSSIGQAGVRVRPFVVWNLIEEVLLVDYESDGVAAALPSGVEPQTNFAREKINAGQ
jgi:rod shape-determining protein MreC